MANDELRSGDREDRRAWLDGLRPGDAVTLHTPFGPRPAVVSSIGTQWIVVEWVSADGGHVIGSVKRRTGDLHAMRVHIEPAEEVLPAIGGAPDALDRRVGGWEAE